MLRESYKSNKLYPYFVEMNIPMKRSKHNGRVGVYDAVLQWRHNERVVV